MIGHVRGVDNRVHPDSRVFVVEVLPQYRRQGVGAALLAAQIQVSDRPLRMKISTSMVAERALARCFGGVAVQATPPWHYSITTQLRGWAERRVGEADVPTATDAPELLDLLAQHYLDQHRAWSPADEAALRAAFADDVDPGGSSGYDPDRSTILRRDGRIVAAGLVWPQAPDAPAAGDEVSLVCARHDDPAGRADMELCLAGVIQRCRDDAVLLIDSHVTEAVEAAMMQGVPGPVGGENDEWMVIVALPVPGGPKPIAMPSGLIPVDAQWIEEEFVRT